ncbi:family transcriptional regulator [Leptolyngbya sp. Heron Island J]|uniref:LysR family transcriptional regulator n=1 Tax=Leptolyngbya sp. Heron Island J TaxID=1385935 RepID=UPI0003B9674D|nr:LysR family transcriptional regulator [Leptolyngbya sp. Heron Island J]ESA33369.1 family transcriptional regulator [Leptolyngbya sp. Heron Island J]
MKLHAFQYFVTLAEELHFGRAAARLQITQPALSRQIHRLEAEMGVTLLYRTKRTVELTEAGTAFLVEVRKALQQLDAAVQLAQRIDRGEVGSLRIAFTPSSMHTVLPDILRNFRDRYPDVKLAMSEICTLDQVNGLRKETIDIGFLHPPLEASFLNLYPLQGERLLIALPEGHALARQHQLSLKSLAAEPFIVHPRHEGPVLYDQFLALCRKAGFEPNIVYRDSKHQTRVGLVAAGTGITYVPESLQKVGLSGVSYCSLVDDFLELQLAVAWRRQQVSPVIEEFLEVVEQVTHD